VTSLHHVIKIAAPADGADHAAGLARMLPNLLVRKTRLFQYLSLACKACRLTKKNSGSSGISSPAQRPSLKVGKVFHIAQTRSVNASTLEHDRDAIIRRPSRTCTFQGDAEPSKAKGHNVHAPRSAPMGAVALCPACGGETSIRLIEPMDVQGVECRTFECKQCHERQSFIVARVNEITHVMRH
jgi:hypothetical protein